MEKPKAKKKSNWSKIKHKTYDSKGFGNAESWKQSFENRITKSKPIVFFQGCDSLDSLGMKFKELIKKYHPDIAGETDENKKITQEIIAEYKQIKIKLETN